MATMRVVEYDRYGGPEVLTLRERPVPRPAAGEVLVRVVAAGLNMKDVLTRDGTFRLLAGRRFPKLTGFDVYGEVAEVGPGVTDLAAGQRVWGLLDGYTGGGAAEYVAVPAKWLSAAPAGVGPAEAAGLPLVGLTAIQALRDLGRLTSGERLLIRGASGGVGTAATQLAVAMGAKVTAVAGPDSGEYCRSLGAAEVVDYTRTEVTELTERYDVLLDCHGGGPLRGYLRLLNPGGRFLTAMPTGVHFVRAALGPVLPGPKVRPVVVKSRRADLETLRGYVDAGQIRMPVQQTYRLDEIADAHRAVEPRHSRGKRVLLVADLPG